MSGDAFQPAYLKLLNSGKFDARIKQAYELLRSCVLCGRSCRVNRLQGEEGFCRSGSDLRITSYGPHTGEEAPLVGRYGSGTIFLTNCNLGCVFCQNDDISHLGEGEEYTPDDAASFMLRLQRQKCHNINFVTPTHYLPQLLEAIKIAAEDGLTLPIVWNCGGYESPEALALLDGVVDIYMPDFKFWDEEPSRTYLNAPGYPELARNALREMHRQVGDLDIDKRGIALRGLLVRHLVMPGNLAGTDKFVNWLSEEISPSAYVNIMAQYRPCFKAHTYPEINRRLTDVEYRQAVAWGRQAGLRLDMDVAVRGS